MKQTFLCTAGVIAISCIGAWQPLSAQTPLYTSPPPPWINSGGNPPLKQAEVLPDHRITFRVHAPKALSASVSVGAEHADLHVYPMTKGEDGIWSVTIDPVTIPEIYPYRFDVDGATVQPGNVEVPGATPAVYDVQNVPHGSYNVQDYYSKVRDKNRVLGVYVPPEYYSEPNRRFPVVYDYDDPGNSNGIRYREIMDNLIAEKKAVPMLVVMLTDDSSSGKDAEADRLRNSNELAQDVIPLVDSRYRTMPDRDHRALAGISHNAGATWTSGLHNLDKFAYMGMFSSGMFGGLLPRTTGPHPFALYAPFEPDKVLPPATKAMLDPNHPLKLLYLSDGNIDPRVIPTRQAVEDFKKYGVTPVFEVYPGGHQPKAFRPPFISFVSKIFK